MMLRGRRCKCAACGEFFNSPAGFDKHRTGPYNGDRRCLTVEEMLKAGMTKNAGGWWVSASFDGKLPEHMRK